MEPFTAPFPTISIIAYAIALIYLLMWEPNMRPAMTGALEAQQILNRLLDCEHLADEVDGLDWDEFMRRIEAVREIVVESQNSETS